MIQERFDMYNLAILDEMKIDGEYPKPVDGHYEAAAELDGNELVVTFTESEQDE